MGYIISRVKLANIFSLLLGLSFILFNNSCKEDPKIVDNPVTENDLAPSSTEITTFYFIRHAEKDLSNSEDLDPELTQKGLGRAMNWVNIFDRISLDVIYATNYQRTSMTAAPISVKKNIDINYFDPKEKGALQLLNENVGKKILVVGHSNTTPEMVNELLGSNKYAQMEDSDFGSLYVVSMVGNIATANRFVID